MMKMETYTGTKTVSAALVKRAWYVEYMGWELPKDEDGEELIYLVEYPEEKGSKPNHPNHKGYVTMSPKDVFEKYYSKSSDWLDRVIIEERELSVKISSLSTAIDSGLIPHSQQEIMAKQLSSMKVYHGILETRINNANQ